MKTKGEIDITEDTKFWLDYLRKTFHRVYTYDEIIKLLVSYKLFHEVEGKDGN